jgi:hypothetical protein
MGSVVKSITNVVGDILKSPITQIALGVLTGGTSSLFSGALSMLGGAAGGAAGGGAGGIFGDLLKSFMGGDAGSMLSGAGNALFGTAQNNSGDSGGLLNNITSMFQGWGQNNTQDASTTQAAVNNATQITAHAQAQQQLQQWQAFINQTGAGGSVNF